ncbi:hypothetical protein QTN25_002473 [Entamoeba marina]
MSLPPPTTDNNLNNVLISDSIHEIQYETVSNTKEQQPTIITNGIINTESDLMMFFDHSDDENDKENSDSSDNNPTNNELDGDSNQSSDEEEEKENKM